MCECVRASRGARGPGSAVTPAIRQEPRAEAARRIAVNYRNLFELLAEGRRRSGQTGRCQRAETPQSSDVVGGSAGSAAGFSGMRETAAFV